MSLCYAVLLDAGFLKYQLGKPGHPIEASDIESFVERIKIRPELAGMRLHRVYFYDSKPLEGSATNPLDDTSVDLGSSETSSRNRSLQAHVSRLPFFSMRYGELYIEGWGLKKRFLKKHAGKNPVEVGANDIRPVIKQKGVDMRIGLDIASLTLKKHAQVIVLATGDSDFIPAMKFARREGAQLILIVQGKGVREGLREHADIVIDNL